ncbi:DUF3850 domain-containing protein [Paenibacillus sp. FSL P4-0176]|uniref:DUF3850 domain-containing protein n=1 Tax=Paenibacillus sp. FSL P4-0176 TaxID=2921631 RepID=UPI0030D2E8E5
MERTTKKHELKVLPEYFKALWDGIKTFEVRLNDRDYQVGDMLFLLEIDPETKIRTGSGLCKRVTYILDAPEYVKEGYVIMGLSNWSRKADSE